MSARDAAQIPTRVPPDLLASIPPSHGSSPFQNIPAGKPSFHPRHSICLRVELLQMPELRLKIYRYVFFINCRFIAEIAVTDGIVTDDGPTDTSEMVTKKENPDSVAILRVNRQIYFEAIPILYAVTTLVNPENAQWQIKSVQPKSHRYQSLCYPQVYLEQLTTSCVDDTPQTPASIGARLRPRMSDLYSINYYEISLDWAGDQKKDRLVIVVQLNFTRHMADHWKGWDRPEVMNQWEYHGADATLNSDIENWVIRRIRQDSSVRTFVEKIRKVSWVAHLDVEFNIETWPPKSQRMDPEAEDFEARQKIWRKGDMNVAKIFLETGILDPLQELDNVGSWCIELIVRDQSGMDALAHERMKLDLTGCTRTKS